MQERGERRMDTNKLKGKLTEKGKTYKDGAELLNISTNAFSNKINHKSRFYVDEINKLAKWLDIFLNYNLHILQEINKGGKKNEQYYNFKSKRKFGGRQ